MPGDQALALIFYTGIAGGVVLVSAAGALNVNLFQFLFGSILTVTRSDLAVIAALGAGALVVITLLYRPLVAVVVDEEGARVAGLPVGAAELAHGRAGRGDDRALDARRRHPADRGADGAAGDRGVADRVEHALDDPARNGNRARVGARRDHDRVLRRPSSGRNDRARRRCDRAARGVLVGGARQ